MDRYSIGQRGRFGIGALDRAHEHVLEAVEDPAARGERGEQSSGARAEMRRSTAVRPCWCRTPRATRCPRWRPLHRNPTRTPGSAASLHRGTRQSRRPVRGPRPRMRDPAEARFPRSGSSRLRTATRGEMREKHRRTAAKRPPGDRSGIEAYRLLGYAPHVDNDRHKDVQWNKNRPRPGIPRRAALP